MINILEKQFDPTSLFSFEWTGRLAKKIKERSSILLKGLGAYFKRLLFPLYLFPIKLVLFSGFLFI